MSTRARLTVAFFVISLLPLRVVSAISWTTAHRSIREQVLDHLESIATVQANRLQAIVEQNLERYNRERGDAYRQKMDRILADALASIPSFEALSVPGVIAGRSRVDNILDLTSDYAGLGQTGETVVARSGEDGQAIFLTPLRHRAETALTHAPSSEGTLPIERALAGDEVLIDDAVDYRGYSVLAVTRYVRPVGWGLVAKTDGDAALTRAAHQLKDMIGDSDPAMGSELATELEMIGSESHGMARAAETLDRIERHITRMQTALGALMEE